MEYIDAKNILDNKRGGDKNSKKIANNTYLKRYDDGTIAVRLHQTDIIQYKPNGDIILNSGGWRTVTTKARMNEYLPRPYGVLQEKGVWYVQITPNGWNKDLVYNDEMTLKKGMKPTNPKVIEAREKKTKREINQIKKYAKRYVDALFDGKVETPSGADCWNCSIMYNKDHDSSDHYKKHLTEMYFVPSLLFHALEEEGTSVMVKQTVGAIWQGQKPYDGNFGNLARDQIEKTLVKFLKRKIQIAN